MMIPIDNYIRPFDSNYNIPTNGDKPPINDVAPS